MEKLENHLLVGDRILDAEDPPQKDALRRGRFEQNHQHCPEHLPAESHTDDKGDIHSAATCTKCPRFPGTMHQTDHVSGVLKESINHEENQEEISYKPKLRDTLSTK